jgi:cytochrome c biogenesis protein CcdA
MIGWQGLAAAVWLGVLTSISPCPLAGNIAAISLMSRAAPSRALSLAAGLLYTVGRVVAYALVAAAVLAGLAGSGAVSRFLQGTMNQLVGPLLILAGLWLMEWIGRGWGLSLVSADLQRRTQRSPLVFAGPLGFLLALSFCPTSAALFFLGLLPLCELHDSRIAMPVVYGVGSALPVLVFLALMLLAQPLVNRALERLTHLERWLRRATAAAFIVIGVYYCLRYVYELPI